jgi:hypothetical protein
MLQLLGQSSRRDRSSRASNDLCELIERPMVGRKAIRGWTYHDEDKANTNKSRANNRHNPMCFFIGTPAIPEHSYRYSPRQVSHQRDSILGLGLSTSLFCTFTHNVVTELALGDKASKCADSHTKVAKAGNAHVETILTTEDI